MTEIIIAYDGRLITWMIINFSKLRIEHKKNNHIDRIGKC